MSPDLSGGGRALDLIDRVLAGRPHKDDVALVDCARELCVYRDALIVRQRAAPTEPAARRDLEVANAVLVVVLAVHFPIDAVPWEELEKARGWLAGLLSEDRVTAA